MTNLPNRYFVDPDSNLALNTPNQWSQSPYLGSVRSSDSYYYSQITIPQGIWYKIIHQNNQKWKNLPNSFLHNNSGNIKISGFNDPRQAAWFMQEVLYSENNDTEELIEDYLEMKYCSGLGDIWNDLLQQIPEFEGSEIKSSDEKDYFAKFDVETRKKISIQKKNAEDYKKIMIRKISNALKDANISHDMDLIEKLGIEHFVTSYGSVVVKDVKNIKLELEFI